MSKKQMKYWQKDRDEQARVNYWCNGRMEGAEWYAGRPRPVHGVHQVAGILGVPVELMNDIDEKPLSIASAKRRFGHSCIGQPCSTGGQYKRRARSLSLLMAVDVNVGLVAHWIYEGSTTKEPSSCSWVCSSSPRFVVCDVFCYSTTIPLNSATRWRLCCVQRATSMSPGPPTRPSSHLQSQCFTSSSRALRPIVIGIRVITIWSRFHWSR